MRGRRAASRGAAALASVLMCVAAFPADSAAQSDGGTGSAVAGAALGLYSGATLGLVGSLEACNRTLLGSRCAGFSTAFGGIVGLVSGTLVGTGSSEAVADRWRGALYGSLIGAFAGGLLQGAVRQYAWDDALLVAALGGAVGAAPEGAVLGLAGGTVLGGLAWVILPQGGPADVVLLGLVGSAVGSLVDWVAGAAEAQGGGPGLMTSFSIPVG